MSDKIDDGGAAFPKPDITDDGRGIIPSNQEGITARDYFASAALTGMLSHSSDNGSGNWAKNTMPSDVAKYAYMYADEMILARKQK